MTKTHLSVQQSWVWLHMWLLCESEPTLKNFAFFFPKYDSIQKVGSAGTVGS